MRASYFFGALLVSTLVAACSSSSAAKNVDSKGAFAFEGDGWTHVNDSKGEYWTKGTMTVVAELDPSGGESSAQSWAEGEYESLHVGSSGTTSLLAPTGIGSGYWFGGDFSEDGSNVYDSYFVDGKRNLHFEIHGPSLSQGDAAAVVSTAQIL